MACSGSHFSAIPPSKSERLVSANIFPPTLNTSVSASKGKPSVTPFLEMQYSRNSSIFMLTGKKAHCHYDQADQEDKHGNFVDAVHYFQVKSRFAVRIRLPEKIGGYFREIK